MVEQDRVGELRRLVDGYRVSQAIHVAAVLGIADVLAGGPRTTPELAAMTGTHEPSLYRLLRALAAEGVCHELDDRCFELGPLGEPLRTDVAGSLAGWAEFVGTEAYRAAWGDLLHSVQTGENAFTHVHGEDVWSYRSARPDENAVFNRAMASAAAATSAIVTTAYDFARFPTIVDVGGGTGAFLAAVLRSAPDSCGVLFDLPHVVTGAGPILERAGVADRCDVIGGSFFETVPADADAYVLRRIVHDWTDDDAARILGVVRGAIATTGTVLVVEQVIDPPNEGAPGKFSDLNMLVSPGGRERTAEEFAALFDASGFRLTRVVRAGSDSVVEAAVA